MSDEHIDRIATALEKIANVLDRGEIGIMIRAEDNVFPIYINNEDGKNLLGEVMSAIPLVLSGGLDIEVTGGESTFPLHVRIKEQRKENK
ncbi:MAG: hypothetical protein AABY46_08215 [Nitrospirota bacterium]